MKQKAHTSLLRVQKLLLAVILSLLLGFTGYRFVTSGQTVTVAGSSMSPTLQDGDRIHIQIGNDIFRHRDIVVIRKDGESYIKRLIALPHDTVSITGDIVYVNDIPICREGGIDPNIPDARMDYPLTLQDGEYFVMGDNRTNSWDSRSLSFGVIYEDEILATVNEASGHS